MYQGQKAEDCGYPKEQTEWFWVLPGAQVEDKEEVASKYIAFPQD